MLQLKLEKLGAHILHIWLTTNIRCEMNTRDYLKKRVVETNSKKIHRGYKDKRNEVNKLIKSAKFQSCITSN